MITALPPCRCAMPGPLVETGSEVARVCDVETFPGLFGDGDGEGEGETDGDGEGIVTSGDDAGEATVTGACVAVDVFRPRWLAP